MTSDADIGDCTKSCRDISRLFKDYLVTKDTKYTLDSTDTVH